MKRLVLAGGGHAHVEVLRRLRLAPIEDVEVVLVSPHADTPYSGMLPGLVAGLYRRTEAYIALAPLARLPRARFVIGRVALFAPAASAVVLEDGERLEYDVLSLDIGSTPATAGVPGAREHTIGVKPVDAFLARFAALVGEVRAGAVRRIAVVGGGAAGIEVLLAMRQRLAAEGAPAVEWRLVTDAAELLPSHAAGVRKVFARVLAERGVAVHLDHRAERVLPGRVLCAAGREIAADAIVWAIGAGPPALLRDSGLALDGAGFVAVGETLQSSSHANVFAAGDVASIIGHPRPRSGVYAVRQGPPLAHNLRAALQGEALVRHVPQRHALAIISTGNRYAVATRGNWVLEGRWVWRWKDWVDRRFMARYAPPA